MDVIPVTGPGVRGHLEGSERPARVLGFWISKHYRFRRKREDAGNRYPTKSGAQTRTRARRGCPQISETIIVKYPMGLLAAPCFCDLDAAPQVFSVVRSSPGILPRDDLRRLPGPCESRSRRSRTVLFSAKRFFGSSLQRRSKALLQKSTGKPQTRADLNATPIRLDAASYEQLRQQVLRRDGWQCQSCGTMSNVQVHQQFRAKLEPMSN